MVALLSVVSSVTLTSVFLNVMSLTGQYRTVHMLCSIYVNRIKTRIMRLGLLLVSEK